jgi:hypothetical protein
MEYVAKKIEPTFFKYYVCSTWLGDTHWDLLVSSNVEVYPGFIIMIIINVGLCFKFTQLKHLFSKILVFRFDLTIE